MVGTYGYIAHHGIKGQKWGIRRYENPDGTLTEAGKRRYRKYQNPDGSLTDKGEKRYATKLGSIKTPYGKENVYKSLELNKRGLKTRNIDRVAFDDYVRKKNDESEKLKRKRDNEYKAMLKLGKQLWPKVDMIDQDGSIRKNPKRSDRAAIVGLKAMGENDFSKQNKDWFLYEDQTTGMPTIADLAIQGYSKKQIKSLMEYAYKNYGYTDDDKPGMFGLSEGYYGITDKYIDNCIKYGRNIK